MTYAPAPQLGEPAGGAPLSRPLYGASLPQAFARFWQKYATFSGRASRSEFWWWHLIHVLVIVAIIAFMIAGGIAGATVDPVTGKSEPGFLLGVGTAVLVLWELVTVVPLLALYWRRLHDADFAGPFYFLNLIAGLGGIVVLVLVLLPANPRGARFDR